MNVILTEAVAHRGSAGDMLKVRDGYARNYLIPKGMAIVATTENIKQLEHQKRQIQAKQNKLKKESEGIARHIESISCTIARAAGEEDKLFGSVTSADIYTSLKNEGIDIDKKKILLDEPLKSLGIFTVPIKIQSDVTANLKVWVVKE